MFLLIISMVSFGKRLVLCSTVCGVSAQCANQNLDDMFMKKLTHLSLCQIFQRLHADPGLPVESSAPGFVWRLSHHGCHAHQLGELLKA